MIFFVIKHFFVIWYIFGVCCETDPAINSVLRSNYPLCENDTFNITLPTSKNQFFSMSSENNNKENRPGALFVRSNLSQTKQLTKLDANSLF